MKALTRIRVNRVKEELYSGASVRDIVSKLSAEFGIVPRSMDYLITKAHRELETEITEDEQIRQQLRAAQVEREIKMMTSKDEVDNYLSELIRGKSTEEKVMSTAAGPKVVRVGVSTLVILKAIELYYCRLDKNKT